MTLQKPPVNLPSNQVPLIDPKTGVLTPAWRAFFDDIVSAAPPIDDTLTLDPSPATYTAIHPGFLLIVGGTVSQVDLIRARVTVTTGQTAGFFPMSQDDQLEITYAVVPAIYFLPTGNPT